MSMDVSDAQSSIYTKEELEIMGKTRDIRMAAINNIVLNADPKDKYYNSSARVLNELLSSAEKAAHDAATNRLKYQSGANKEAILETVMMALKTVSTSKQLAAPTDLTLRQEIIDITVVDGELEIDPTKLLLEDFTELKEK